MENKFYIRDIGLKHGFLLGVTMSCLFIAVMLLGLSGNIMMFILRNGLIIGTTIFAHHTFKKLNEGVMSFGEGVRLGMLLISVAYVFYSFTTFIYTRFIDSNTLLEMREQLLFQFENQDRDPKEIEQMMEAMESIMTPEGFFILGILGGVITALFYSLIISSFTKKEAW